MSLTKTGIEYLDYCWNWLTGCLHWKTGVCAVGENCYAKTLAHRFHRSFEPTLHPEKLLDPLHVKKPTRIGVCFTADSFGDWVDPEQELVLPHYKFPRIFTEINLKTAVNRVISHCPQHQFFFLTKNPKGYLKWHPFPDNAWCGWSVCREKDLNKYREFKNIDVKHKWLSFEPLYEKVTDFGSDSFLTDCGISWCVIGAQTGRHPIQPKIEWVKEIVEACDKAGVKVWLKNNLKPLIPGIPLRQELP